MFVLQESGSSLFEGSLSHAGFMGTRIIKGTAGCWPHPEEDVQRDLPREMKSPVKVSLLLVVSPVSAVLHAFICFAVNV